MLYFLGYTKRVETSRLLSSALGLILLTLNRITSRYKQFTWVYFHGYVLSLVDAKNK